MIKNFFIFKANSLYLLFHMSKEVSINFVNIGEFWKFRSILTFRKILEFTSWRTKHVDFGFLVSLTTTITIMTIITILTIKKIIFKWCRPNHDFIDLWIFKCYVCPFVSHLMKLIFVFNSIILFFFMSHN